ncbi:DUF2510 domain-containing protein [Streptomyces sp. XD-27]|uniref:DUF2510 domain-containing protein n=1 Tax=Streptomyces sp. XD-27 TaxID=3062779 RepID=UPI0026F420E3|nr:DUF2510 domain-containing protein [Streptomyces sp. XD-27]WKX74509.1 DUF2510 domain-containing protein [Streptomyces sp. XD-27]
MTTPPGWYPDPAHSGPGPAPERWWDGAAWTEQRRTAQPAPQSAPQGQPAPGDPSLHAAPTMVGMPGPAAPAAPAPGTPQPGFSGPPGYPGSPGAPGYPGYPATPDGAAPRGRGSKAAAAAVAAVVLVAAIVGGVLLLQDDGDGKRKKRAKPGQSTSAPRTGGQNGGQGGDGPAEQPGSTAADAINGISLPVFAGWEKQNHPAGVFLGKQSYPCPNNPNGTCLRGGVVTENAAGGGYRATTAEGIAKEDIAGNAKESYSVKSYGGITSHTELKSEPVTVAGEQGYRVLWRVKNKMGGDGYVQSVVFPRPGGGSGGSQSMIVVQFGFDVNDQAPTLDDMDKIVKGIKPLGSPGNNESV